MCLAQKTASKVIFEYIDSKDFKSFINYNEDKLFVDIVQKFPVAKSKYHEVIRCDWTPTINIIEKRTNPNVFKNSNVSIYERIVTYEGPSQFSKTQGVVSNMILSDINVACKFISDQLTSHNISLKHANFYFKIDDSNELVLILANNLKTEPHVRIS